MGTSYGFKCPECGKTLFSPTGRSCGMMAVVQPMICRDCNEVVQILIGEFGKDGPTGDPEFDKRLNICPECGGKNLRKWSKHHPCPKCGTGMKKDPELGGIDWD